MAKTIVVKQIGSPIRRPEKQRQTLIGLGLNKMHKTRELEDTPSVRGMVNKIPHLVEIIEEKGCGPSFANTKWPGSALGLSHFLPDHIFRCFIQSAFSKEDE